MARHKVHKVKWLQNYMPPQEFFFSLTFSSRKKKLKGPKRNLAPATLCTLWCRAHPPPPPTPATQTRSHPKMKPLLFARDNPSSALLQVTQRLRMALGGRSRLDGNRQGSKCIHVQWVELQAREQQLIVPHHRERGRKHTHCTWKSQRVIVTVTFFLSTGQQQMQGNKKHPMHHDFQPQYMTSLVVTVV